MKPLTKQIEGELFQRAWAAARLAYAPFSKYKVGAALLLPNGSIISGSNVENSSYGLTICSERAAIFAAVNRGYREILAISVVWNQPGIPLPCGGCRQVLAEFATARCPILCQGRKSRTRRYTLGELLPHHFQIKIERG